MENKAQDKKEDKLILGGHEFNSRFILGSGKYNVNLIKAAVEQGGAEIITLALRRANTENKENILDFIPKGVTLLPNTSGARNAEEAVRIARLSREMGCGDVVKIEILIDEIDLPIIVDAGIGKPSQACEAMEMGAAAVMANTAIATAGNVPAMAEAFKKAIEAGRSAYLTGMGRVLARGGSASDPLTGFLR